MGKKPVKRRAPKRSVSNIALDAVHQKLDRLIQTTDKTADIVQKHAEILAKQEVTLADHVRRTLILEGEVVRLDRFRSKLTAIAAFTVALSTLVVSILKVWF